jgi:ATP-dependent 26S proteasome regulatory subunit
MVSSLTWTPGNARRSGLLFVEPESGSTHTAAVAAGFSEEVETLIRARYPIIYIVSPEEQRVQQLLVQIAERRQKTVYEWSCTTGLVPSGASIQLSKNRNSPTRDPLAALDQVIEQVDPAIFLFKDLHPFLNRQNHSVIRKLKEIALQLKNSFKTIVLVSATLEVPVEIEKELTVVHLPLPSAAELSILLDQIISDVRRFRQIKIDLDDGGRERLLQAARGLTLNEAENVFARILVEKERLSGEEVGEVLEEKRQIVRKNGLLEYYDARESFADVGGLGALKDWLQKRAVAFTPAAREFGLSTPRGVLLIGVQGCGKSLCAKAVASLWELPLLRFDIGRMFGSYVGSSEENIRRAIHVAESVAPAILWVDEIDKAFSGNSGNAGDSGTSARVLGTFLTWLNEKTAPVFVVATANDISNLPPELLRKGRLDEIFFVDLPGREEREEIFAIHLRRRNREPEGFPLGALAEKSEGFSGAEIEEAINSALYEAFYEGVAVNEEHLLIALKESVPLSRTMHEHLSELREWAHGRARPAGGEGRISIDKNPGIG